MKLKINIASIPDASIEIKDLVEIIIITGYNKSKIFNGKTKLSKLCFLVNK